MRLGVALIVGCLGVSGFGVPNAHAATSADSFSVAYASPVILAPDTVTDTVWTVLNGRFAALGLDDRLHGTSPSDVAGRISANLAMLQFVDSVVGGFIRAADSDRQTALSLALNPVSDAFREAAVDDVKNLLALSTARGEGWFLPAAYEPQTELAAARLIALAKPESRFLQDITTTVDALVTRGQASRAAADILHSALNRSGLPSSQQVVRRAD